MPFDAMKHGQVPGVSMEGKGAAGPLLRTLVVLLGLGLVQCQADGPKGVEVTPLLPAGLGATVISYQVAVTLDGKPAWKGPQRVAADKVPFTLVLPPDSRGQLVVEMLAGGQGAQDLGVGALRLAAGRASIEIGHADEYQLTLPLERAACLSDGWCYDRGPSRSVNLRAVWGSAPNDVWVVGDRGTVLHWDGFAWDVVNSGTSADLFGVWGSNSGAVWFVGADGLIARVGDVPQRHAEGRLLAIAGSGPQDIWAVGDRGIALYYDGSQWRPNRPNTGSTLHGVWAGGPEDVWVVGERGTLAHWDGKTWSLQQSNVTVPLHAVIGPRAAERWIAADKGMLLQLQDGKWLPVKSGVSGALYALWGDGGGDLWAAGQDGVVLRREGNHFHPVPVPMSSATLYGLWGMSAGQVWVVGAQGTILHQGDQGWTLLHRAVAEGISARW